MFKTIKFLYLLILPLDGACTLWVAGSSTPTEVTCWTWDRIASCFLIPCLELCIREHVATEITEPHSGVLICHVWGRPENVQLHPSSSKLMLVL